MIRTHRFVSVFAVGPNIASVSSDVLDGLRSILLSTRVGSQRVTIASRDADLRSIGRRAVAKDSSLEAASGSWMRGDTHVIEMLNGSPDDGFATSNMIQLATSKGIIDRLSSSIRFCVLAMLTLPADENNFVEALLQNLLGRLEVSYGFVHCARHMSCVSNEVITVSRPSCIVLPESSTIAIDRSLAEERDDLVRLGMRTLGEKMLDVHAINYVTGDLYKRLQQLTADLPRDSVTWTSPRENVGILRLNHEMLPHDDREYIQARSRMRKVLASECALASWRGFL
jgi:hypothetical protein